MDLRLIHLIASSQISGQVSSLVYLLKPAPILNLEGMWWSGHILNTDQNLLCNAVIKPYLHENMLSIYPSRPDISAETVNNVIHVIWKQYYITYLSVKHYPCSPSSNYTAVFLVTVLSITNNLLISVHLFTIYFFNVLFACYIIVPLYDLCLLNKSFNLKKKKESGGGIFEMQMEINF